MDSSAAPVLHVGGEISDLTDRVLDAMVVNLQEFTKEELLAVADYREDIWRECCMAKFIRQYVEAWR